MRLGKLCLHLRLYKRAVVHLRVLTLGTHRHFGTDSRKLRLRLCAFNVVFSLLSCKLRFHLRFNKRAVVYRLDNGNLLCIVRTLGKQCVEPCNFRFCLSTLFVVFSLCGSHFRAVAFFENTLTFGFLFSSCSLFLLGELSILRGNKRFCRAFLLSVSLFRPCGFFPQTTNLRFGARPVTFVTGICLGKLCLHLGADKRAVVVIDTVRHVLRSVFAVCVGAGFGNFGFGTRAFHFGLRLRPDALGFGLRFRTGAGNFGVRFRAD